MPPAASSVALISVAHVARGQRHVDRQDLRAGRRSPRSGPAMTVVGDLHLDWAARGTASRGRSRGRRTRRTRRAPRTTRRYAAGASSRAPRVERVADVAHRRAGRAGSRRGPRRGRAAGRGRSASARSATSDASPVDTVTTPVRPRPHPPAQAARCRRSARPPRCSSSRSSHRITPAASSAASVTRSSPARLPLCAIAAACAWADRPDLDREDRLAQLERVVGEGEEPLRPLEALDEQHDRVRLGVVEAVGEVVAQVEHDLRADATRSGCTRCACPARG